ncbi:MAG: cytochrome c [Nitrospiria bacterium]
MPLFSLRGSAAWIALAGSLLGLWIATGSVRAAGDLDRGKILYDKNCRGCHGKTGLGLGGATPNLGDTVRMGAASDAELFAVVTNGRPGTGMPAWGKVLTEQDRWNVVGYLRTLAR